MIVLDTHALLWWALDPDRLSVVARDRLREMEKSGGFASSISIWELGVKVRNGRLDMGISVEELARRLERGGVVELVPVDTTVWLKSLALEWAHRDPADRVIVATALLRGVPLLTKDDAIRSYAGITTLW